MELIKNETFVLTKESLMLIGEKLMEFNYIYYEYDDSGEVQTGSTRELFLEQLYKENLEDIKTNVIIQLESFMKNLINAEVLITPTNQNQGIIINIQNLKGIHLMVVGGTET